MWFRRIQGKGKKRLQICGSKDTRKRKKKRIQFETCGL